MKTAVSLFTGCGGSDAGLIEAGFEILMANDILPHAKAVYEANFPETDYQCKSIKEISAFPKADLLAGCYPCQGFSQGGAREAGREINFLYQEFDRALRAIKPKAFIVENVSGMRRSDNIHLLRNQITRFRLAGYRVSAGELNAADYGVPQERKRIFLVGVRSDLDFSFEFPEATHGPQKNKDHVTIKVALEGLPIWPEGKFHTEPFHWYYMSRNRRRDWHEVSKTIVSHPRHMPLHPISPPLKRIHTDKWIWESDDPARRFSYEEAARLQGFGKNFSFPEASKMAHNYKVVGNAVPPALFSAIAKELVDL